jgi:hypothetical protein
MTLHSWQQGLTFATMIDDHSQTNQEHAPYHI